MTEVAARRLANRDGCRARYLCVGFDSLKPATRRPFIELRHQLLVQNRFTVEKGAPTVRRAPVKRCIYCGETEFIPGSGKKLSEEHVIPEGLGGNLVVPEASCERCNSITSKIERAILKTTLLTPRRFLKIRGKKKKREEMLFPLAQFVDGKNIKTELPLEDHPAMIFLPVFDPPGILVGRRPNESGLVDYWTEEVIQGSMNEIISRGRNSFATPHVDLVRFCQFLGKIAYSFIVSELGMDGVSSRLPKKLILRPVKDSERLCRDYFLVGGEAESYAKSTELHRLGWSIAQKQGVSYAIVTIRLFSHLSAPVYRVVAGIFAGDQLENAMKIERTSIAEGRV
jgi:hypothetical protein